MAWCVMPTHYHLAVRSGPVPLARTMGYVQARFGQQHNRRVRSSGPLWQSRYKANLVEDERQLAQLVGYIHLNPVAAGVAAEPGAYAWSSHRELMGQAPARLVDAMSTTSTLGDTSSVRRSPPIVWISMDVVPIRCPGPTTRGWMRRSSQTASSSRTSSATSATATRPSSTPARYAWPSRRPAASSDERHVRSSTMRYQFRRLGPALRCCAISAHERADICLASPHHPRATVHAASRDYRAAWQ